MPEASALRPNSALPAPIALAQAPADWSRYEGMRLTLPGPLTVTGNDDLLRQGALDVSFAGRLVHATERHAPGVEAEAMAAANAAARVRLDDGTVCNVLRMSNEWLHVATGDTAPPTKGAEWSGVYFSELYGYLHIVQDGNTITGKWQLEQPDLRFPLLREIDVVSLTAPPVPLGSTRSEGTRTRLDLAGRWSP